MERVGRPTSRSSASRCRAAARMHRLRVPYGWIPVPNNPKREVKRCAAADRLGDLADPHATTEVVGVFGAHLHGSEPPVFPGEMTDGQVPGTIVELGLMSLGASRLADRRAVAQTSGSCRPTCVTPPPGATRTYVGLRRGVTSTRVPTPVMHRAVAFQPFEMSSHVRNVGVTLGGRGCQREEPVGLRRVL